MADGKKSFVLYCDFKEVFNELSDQDAGQLIKHIFQYVNDENPVTDNPIVKISFIPIKNQLKRDLKEWETERHQRSESGRTGGLRSGETRRKQAEAKRRSASKNEANEAVTVNVTVNDTVTVDVFNNIKRNFFNDFRWKEKFCEKKEIQMPALEILMNDFITDIELKEDYKSLQELKKHFTNLFNKNGTHQQTNTKGAKLGTSAARIERAKNW